MFGICSDKLDLMQYCIIIARMSRPEGSIIPEQPGFMAYTGTTLPNFIYGMECTEAGIVTFRKKNPRHHFPDLHYAKSMSEAIRFGLAVSIEMNDPLVVLQGVLPLE